MTTKKMLHGREYKISCGRFNRDIKVEVDGIPAARITKNMYRAVVSENEYVEFSLTGSFMTGMNLTEGGVTIEVFRHIRWYEYIFIFFPLLFLAAGSVLGISTVTISGLAAAIGGIVGIVMALAGFFSCEAIVHSEKLKHGMKIFLNILVLCIYTALFVAFYINYMVVLIFIGLGDALENAAFLQMIYARVL